MFYSLFCVVDSFLSHTSCEKFVKLLSILYLCKLVKSHSSHWQIFEKISFEFWKTRIYFNKVFIFFCRRWNVSDTRPRLNSSFVKGQGACPCKLIIVNKFFYLRFASVISTFEPQPEPPSINQCLTNIILIIHPTLICRNENLIPF